MTYVFPLSGSLTRCWKILHAKYRRLTVVLGIPPFEFELPDPRVMNLNQYIPKNGDEIVIKFWDKEHAQVLLSVEMEALPDETKNMLQVFVHPQGNAFEEPARSAMSIWMAIEKTLKKEEKRPAKKTSKRNKKLKPQPGTLIALEELREIYFEALRSQNDIIPRKDAAKKAGIVINTWRTHDRELWDHWEDKKYRNQKMQ